MSNVYFTSDLHLGHANMLSFRSEIHEHLFPTVEYMNQYIVDMWNSAVKNKRDVVWVLGDVAMQDMSALSYLHKCKGIKRLIMGNHDTADYKTYAKYFDSIHGCVRKYGWTLTHVPIHPNEMVYRRWDINIHGHIHHKDKLLGHPYYNVNMDTNGMSPISLQELRERVKKGKILKDGT